jgi:3',5'-nucleoside bisphosphate phosphatase
MNMLHTSLLCELHAHTTWSDGELPLDQVVDLYGRAGYDVLCITDHVVRGQTMVTEDAFVPYLRAIERAATRARLEYGMLVIPGLELTWDDPDPAWAAHAVCVGVHRFIGLDDGLDAALDRAESQGAAIIAAHPHSLSTDPTPGRTTRRWWIDRELRARAHRFELINRNETFGWVASSELPAVANGDFHTFEHLHTWKTVLPAPRTATGVISYLRSSRPAMIVKPGEPVLPPSADLESLIGVPA